MIDINKINYLLTNITVDIDDLIYPLQRLKKKQKRCTLSIDTKNKSIYIADKNTVTKILGF